MGVSPGTKRNPLTWLTGAKFGARRLIIGNYENITTAVRYTSLLIETFSGNIERSTVLYLQR